MSNQADILKDFPSEKIQEIETFQEIIYILSKLSEQSIDSAYTSLCSLKIFESQLFLTFTVRKVTEFCEIFPFHIKQYVNLVQVISSNFPNFKTSFLIQLFHRYYFSDDGLDANFVLFVLYCSYKLNIFSIEEILSIFKVLYHEKADFQENNALFFMYFSPEMKESDETFYEEIKGYTERRIQTSNLISDTLKVYFLNTYSKTLIKNNFEILRRYRDDSHLSECPLFEIIYNDDVEQLRVFLSNPNSNVNDVIVHSVISPYREIANNLSLISTAAVFSAVNCFKYLLLNGSKIEGVVSEMGTLAQDTIVGGNVEIIRLAQQSRIDFSGALTTCSFYFRNDLFDWIFESQGNNVEELTKISPAGSTVFCQACRFGNIELLLKCIEMGVDLNAEDADTFPLLQAVLGGSDEVVEIFLTLSLGRNELNNEEEKEEKAVVTKSINDEILFMNLISQYFDLEIESKIGIEEIEKAMLTAVSKGQSDCVKVFINHGIPPDVSHILCAIECSRYTTLAYLFDHCKFELNPENDNSIYFITHSNIHSRKKCFKIEIDKKLFFSYILRFVVKQNNVNVLKLTFEKVNFDMSKKFEKDLVLGVLTSLWTYIRMDQDFDVYNFLLFQYDDINKLQILGNCPQKLLYYILKESSYKDKLIEFIREYESNNDISKSPEIQKIFDDIKAIIE
ncbi:hypothetical protein M9Y10_020229 [Tritrichomonas musculus]|uniref:DUF3447 domain-containing protein n=1 Tax=Tritrichomonas musculus TaxID=1915356 RepID=A0ABR2HGJ6_9EUKA